MRLVLLDKTSGSVHAIFCRGCDKGRPDTGASRDLDSEGKIDIYCDECTRARSTFIVEN